LNRIQVKKFNNNNSKNFFEAETLAQKNGQPKENKIKIKTASIAVVLKTRPQYFLSLNSIFLSDSLILDM